ncbi:MAG: hypothetical protein OEV66_06725 [Spirochaetia bacterium]|nr:hypothetical protein [Spirochaetia bacterium]
MPVSILLVEVPKNEETNARNGINGLNGAEVTETGNGFLVVATDSPNRQHDYNLMEKIQKLRYVRGVSLVMTADENIL